MRALREELADWGCDVQGALARLDGDAQRYHACLNSFRDDAAFDRLDDAVRDQDVAAAAQAAAILQDAAARLGLTPVWQDIYPLAQMYRAGRADGAEALYARLLRTLRQYRDILARY